MSEPRCTLTNVGTGQNMSYTDESLHVLEGMCESLDPTLGMIPRKREETFKLQWCKRNEQIVTTTMIRTDTHPQSLLDCRDLKFQGSALDFSKCNDKHRWWDIVPVSIKCDENEPRYLVAFRSHLNRNKCLGADSRGCLMLGDVKPETLHEDIPKEYVWEIALHSHFLTPAETTAACLFPAVLALGAVEGVAVALGVSVAVAGNLAQGAILAFTAEVLYALSEISNKMFVPWS